MTELVKILAEAERLIAVLNRRGIHFNDFVEVYYSPSKGGLPQFRICFEGQEEIFYEKNKYEKRPNRWQVVMSMPLTPADTVSLRTWLQGRQESGLDPISIPVYAIWQPP